MAARRRKRIDLRVHALGIRHGRLQLDPLRIDQEAVPETLQHMVDQPRLSVEKAQLADIPVKEVKQGPDTGRTIPAGMSSRKDQREHVFVVEDIRARLEPVLPAGGAAEEAVDEQTVGRLRDEWSLLESDTSPTSS